MNNASLFDKALKQVSAEIEAEQRQKGITPQAKPQDQDWGDRLSAQEDEGFFGTVRRGFANFSHSLGIGAVKAGIETKDFIAGEPEESEKSDLRKEFEDYAKDVTEGSTANSLVSGISQFVVGMVGVGKLAAPLKMAQRGRKARAAYEVARGATAGAVVIDPHEQRLSNLVQEFPALQNPVSEYLAADPEDSAAEGRFKNALEGIGLDIAIIGTFAASAKALKWLKAGEPEKAKVALKKAEVEEAPSPQPKAEPQAEKITQEATPAKALPKDSQPKPKIELEESTADSIVASAREDIEAINKFGGREEAVAAGHKFNGTAKLPWQKLSDPEELGAFVQNTADALRPQLDKLKGGDVLSDSRVRQMVAQRAELFNEDPDLLFGMVSKAGENAKAMTANMEASYLVANKMFQDTYETALKIKSGMLDEWGGSAEQAAEFLKNQIKLSSELYGNARSMTAAAGRSLRRMRTEFRIKPEDLAKIDSMDPERLADVLYHTKGNPKKMAESVKPTFFDRVLDEATFSLTNSLLWLYPTHAVNLTSNLYMLLARPAEKVIGSMALGPSGSPIRRQALKEYRYTVAALSDGWSNAVEAFKRGDSAINPHSSEYFDSQASGVSPRELPWRKVESIGDLAHNAYVSANYRTLVGLPTRALGAMDELVKTMRYRAVVQAGAHVDAIERGLSGAELSAYVSGKLAASFDEAGRGLDPAALKESQVATFTQELLPGTFGKEVIQNSRANFKPLALVLPFVKTPLNVLRYAWKMTPGLNMAQGEYRQMISGAMGAEAQAQAIGQMSMGAMFMGIAANLALEGKLTGGGPADVNLKKELMATGWKPYSYVHTDEDGKKTYFPLGRFDPVGMPFGMVADLVDMMVVHPNTREAEKGMGAVAVALAKNFSEKTFLLNMNQAIKAMAEPDKNGTKFLGQLLGNTIPGSSLIRGVNPDPYMRDARGVVDNALKNIPGFSETLPPQRDFLGLPMIRRIGLTSSQSGGEVHAEHNRIIEETGYGIGKAAATRNGVDLRELVLEDGSTAYDKMLEYSANEGGPGPSLEQTLSKLIESKGYQRLVDGPNEEGTKLHAFSRVVAKYREIAFKRLQAEHPAVRQALVSRSLEIRSAIYAKINQEDKEAGRVLDALGLSTKR